MTSLMNVVLPTILPNGVAFSIVTYQGVKDLEARVGDALRRRKNPRERFLILRDNDNGVCTDRKAKLQQIAERSGRADQTKIRIVCQELESWFLGDLAAVEAAQDIGKLTPKAKRALARAAQYPDTISPPAQLLETAFGSYQKGLGARAIAPHMDIARNTSLSFRAFVKAARDLAQAA